MADSKRKFSEKLEVALITQVVGSEYVTGKINNQDATEDYESFLDMFDSERVEREYDWMSNISLGEFASQMLTQSANDADESFQTRDFTEVYLQDPRPEALAASEAAKECINRTLNLRDLYHYQKLIRSKTINNLSGRSYARCWWSQDFEPRRVVDEAGNPSTQQFIIEDRFNYDILDNRNVFSSPEYTYSLAEKKWVIVRFESTFEELEADEEQMGYFNLDRLDSEFGSEETETSRESYNQNVHATIEGKTVSKTFDILERYGKHWVVVKEEIDGQIVSVSPGYGEDGKKLPKAVFIECIISFALEGGKSELIRLQAQPYKSASGVPYRPIIRSICYIHPSDDGGAGDGKYARDIQIGIDDTFNLALDKTRLATLPVLQGTNVGDNATIRFEPLHLMELEAGQEVKEFKMDDNVTGALNQISMLKATMQQLTSITASQQGQLPGLASTTATAIASSGNRSSIRNRYKSTTYEQTFSTDLYWMILQMTYQFARPETGIELMGEKVFNFNPALDYYYKPVSSAIETEQSKTTKINQWNQILQTVAGIQHPNATTAFNDILSRIFELMGDEQVNFGKTILDEQQPLQGQQGQQQGQPGQPQSNQNGVPQSQQEIIARSQANGLA